MKLAALFLLLPLAACPWRGVDDLLAEANVIVVVTGVVVGDEVSLELNGRTSRATVTRDDDDELRLFDRVPQGRYGAVLQHARGSARHCASFDVVASSDVSSTHAVDVRGMSRCDDDDDDADDDVDASDGGRSGDAGDGDGGDDNGGDGGPSDGGLIDGGVGDAGSDGEVDAGPLEDAGSVGADGGAGADGGENEDGGEDEEYVESDAGEDASEDDAGPTTVTFVRLAELSPSGDCTSNCEQHDEIRIEGEGEVIYRSADQELEAVLTTSELEDVALDVLSGEADALFGGDDPECPMPATGDDPIQLERRRALTDGTGETYITERLDVRGCGGIAATLREHLADARAKALASLDGGL